MSVFAPLGSSVKVNLTSSSQDVTLPTVPATNGAVRIVQTLGGTNAIYLKLGSSGVTVSNTDGMMIKPVASGLIEIIGVGASETHMAILVDAGTATTVSITSGSMVG